MSSAFLQVNKMKITKEKLQQIIKEEYQRTLNEMDDPNSFTRAPLQMRKNPNLLRLTGLSSS